MKRNRLVLVLSLAFVVLAALMFVHHRRPSTPQAARAEHGDRTAELARATSSRAPQKGPAEARSDAKPGARSSTPVAPDEARAKRNALRARMMQAQADRAPQGAPSAVPGPPSNDPDRPGTLVDRVGGREALVGHLNREFMPLARECIQRAREESPRLKGMLTLRVVPDDETGSRP